MKLVYLSVFSLFILSCNDTKHTENTSTEHRSIPEIKFKEGAVEPFAPHIFSQFTNVRDFTITPNEREAYFTLLSPARELSIIMKIKKVGEDWDTTEIASFSGQYTDLEPFLSPDGLKLFFASNRPVSKDSTKVKDFDIWYVEREQINSEWSNPINLGIPVNTEKMIFL